MPSLESLVYEHQNHLGENADSSHISLEYHADAKRLEITIILEI